MGVDAVSRGWRLGAVGIGAPAGSSPAEALEFVIEDTAQLGVDIVASGGVPSIEPSRGRELRALAAERGLEIEPWVRQPFDLAGPNAAEARSEMLASIRASKELGGPVLRTGWGNQRLDRTRFVSAPISEQLQFLISNLKLAAELAEAEGVTLAIENHTDYRGSELVQVMEAVGSDHIRLALDTANGMTIFWDPLEDAKSMAPWTVTTHVKDLRVIETSQPKTGSWPLVPFTLTGCLLGEGSIDIEGVLRELVLYSPLGQSIPLIVEPGWPGGAPGERVEDRRRQMLEPSLANLRSMLERLEREIEPASSVSAGN